MTTKEKIFFKLVCVSVDPFEYAVHEDVNKGTLNEACEFILKNFDKHPNTTWQLIPFTSALPINYLPAPLA